MGFAIIVRSMLLVVSSLDVYPINVLTDDGDREDDDRDDDDFSLLQA